MKNSKKLNLQIIICGRGGQGVLFLTRILDEAAVTLGCSVISSETHGMAMRGGSVSSYIKIGNYASPLIRSGEADILMGVNENEVPLNLHLLKKEYQLFVNSASGRHHAVNAEKIARQLGASVVSNLVLLGFACAHQDFPFDMHLIESIVKKISTQKALELNLKALSEGYAIAHQNDCGR